MFYFHNHGFQHHPSRVLDKSRPKTINMLSNYFKKFIIPNLREYFIHYDQSPIHIPDSMFEDRSLPMP